MHLLRRIERFLRKSDMPATRFGRETVRRVHDWLDAREGQAR